MTGPDPRLLIERHSDAGLLEILRALDDIGCTGSLAVTSAENSGVVFIEAGRVVDALVTDGSWLGEGVPAVAFLTNLSYPELVFSDETDFSQRTIDLDMDRLEEMVEQVRPLLLPPGREPEPLIKAPRSAGRMGAADDASAAEVEPAPAPTPVEPTPPPAPPAAVGESDPAPAPAGGAAYAAEAGPSFEGLLEGLRGVYGYAGAAIMDAEGTIVAGETVDESTDPGTVGPVFAQIIRLVRETTAAVGLGECSRMTAVTPAGTVITRHADLADPVQIVCILRPGGNDALAGLRLDSALSALARPR